MMSTGWAYTVEQLGVFTPKKIPVDTAAGRSGYYIITGIKQVADCKIGDTITEERRPADAPLPGFKPSQWCSAGFIQPMRLSSNISKIRWANCA